MSALAPRSSLRGLAVVQAVDEQLLARALAACGAAAVDVADGVAQHGLLVGVEGAHQSVRVVGVPDQQGVQRQQELALLVGDAGDVGDVPRADDVAVGGAELHPARARDERHQRVVVTRAGGVAGVVGGGGAVGDVDPPAL